MELTTPDAIVAIMPVVMVSNPGESSVEDLKHWSVAPTIASDGSGFVVTSPDASKCEAEALKPLAEVQAYYQAHVADLQTAKLQRDTAQQQRELRLASQATKKQGDVVIRHWITNGSEVRP